MALRTHACKLGDLNGVLTLPLSEFQVWRAGTRILATKELATPTDYKGRPPTDLTIAIFTRCDDFIIVNIVMALGPGREVAATRRVAGSSIADTLSFPDPDRKIVKAVTDVAVYVDTRVPLHYRARFSEK